MSASNAVSAKVSGRSMGKSGGPVPGLRARRDGSEVGRIGEATWTPQRRTRRAVTVQVGPVHVEPRLGARHARTEALQQAPEAPRMVHLDQVGDLVRGEIVERSEEHTSELQSQSNLVCRLLLE